MEPRRGRPVRSERGASAAEYAILISLIAVVILVGVTVFGTSVNGLFTTGCDAVAASHGESC